MFIAVAIRPSIFAALFFFFFFFFYNKENDGFIYKENKYNNINIIDGEEEIQEVL